MTGLGCNNNDEEGCEISCHSQGLLSRCHMGDMGDMGDRGDRGYMCVMYVMYDMYVCYVCMYVM